MSLHCPKCGSTRVVSRGYAERKTGEKFRRCNCQSCSSWFQIALTISSPTPQIEFDYYDDGQESLVVAVDEDKFGLENPYPDEDSDNIDDDVPKSWLRDDSYINEIKKYDKLVITSAQNNAELNHNFFKSLLRYCSTNNARLVVIPTKLRINGDGGVMDYPEELHPYLIDNDLTYPTQRLSILCGMKVIPTAVNPLAGKDARSKGDSLIIGHPQYQMRTMARGFDRKYPPILSTTGSVTIGKYSTTTAGDIAKFNHCAGAVVIELTEDDFFIRNLNWDDAGAYFYDLDRAYYPSWVDKNLGVSAIVTGDSHVMFHDDEVYQATFGEGGLVDTLKPEYLVRHDILDFHSRSHHGKNDPLLEYVKAIKNHNRVEDELDGVVKFLNDTTPKYAKNLIVCSNHDTHIDQWIKRGDYLNDAINAKIGHYLAYKLYDYIDKNNGQTSMALAEFCDGKIQNETIFLKETDTFKLHGIELAVHGHSGANGARGSAMQFSRMPDKLVCGHSHSPQVNKGCYQVGTSSVFHMDYVKSPSSWDHVHCVIYDNGKRQMIHLRNGKFRR